MTFDPPLIPATMIKRYKRFLADVELADGTVVTAHCANSGSMKACWAPGWEVRLSPAANPKRKLKYTLEMLHNGRCWIGVNTMNPNRVVLAAAAAGEIPEIAGYDDYRGEVRYGKNSRIDLLCTRGEERCYVEVKNTTLVAEAGAPYEFPDAVTARGLKHLQELGDMVEAGHRAVMLFFIQRADGSHFRPARAIDPDYADGLAAAQRRGVEILAYRAEVTPAHIRIAERVDWKLA
jgi:sugar fermentation stimulation protein A